MLCAMTVKKMRLTQVSITVSTLPFYKIQIESNTGNKSATYRLTSRNTSFHQASDWSCDIWQVRQPIASSHACDNWKCSPPFLFKAGCWTCSQIASWMSIFSRDQSKAWWSLEFPDAMLPVSCKFISSIWFNLKFYIIFLMDK